MSGVQSLRNVAQGGTQATWSGPGGLMVAALIGLIGIAVGAVLGGVVNLSVEASKRRKLAYAAGQLIAAELDVVMRRMASSKSSSGAQWWSGELPSEAWKAHMSELATCAPVRRAAEGEEDAAADLPAKLSKIYALIGRWDVVRTSTGTTSMIEGRAALPPPPVEADLDSDIERIRSVRSELLSYVNGLAGPRRVAIQRQITIATVIVILSSFVGLMLVPRFDVNATTVASALETRLGSSELVDCESSGDHWACTDYHLSEPRSACLTAPVASSNQSSSGILSVGLIRQAAPCGQSGMPTLYEVVQNGSELICSPAQREQNVIRAAINPVPVPKKNSLARAWDWLRGRS